MGQAIVERTALKIDAAFLTGTGAANTITSFTSMAGTSGTTLGAGVIPRIDNLLDAQGSLLAANASLDSAAWFMHPDMFTRLRKIRDGSGTTFRLLGVPVRVSTQVPGTQVGGKIILADMNLVAVGRDTAPSLGAFTETFRLRPALSAGGGPLRHQAAQRCRHLHHHHRVMAEQRAEKAPEKTVEGLRRAGVVLYDVDPDQLACIACGQQWQATSLRGQWWRCPNGCPSARAP